MKNYKGYALSFLAGAIMMVSTQSFAAVGDKVEAIFAEFNLVINGQPKTMDTVPLVYNGTSYLPIRDISNLLNYNVTYKADSRTIELTVTGDTYAKPTTLTQPPVPPVVEVDTKTYYSLKDVRGRLGTKYKNDFNKDEVYSTVLNMKIIFLYEKREYPINEIDYFYEPKTDAFYISEEFYLQFLASDDLSGLIKHSVDRKNKTVN